jgi:hypothetical protein
MFLFYFLLLVAVVFELRVTLPIQGSMTLATPPHHFCFRSLFQIGFHIIPRDIFIIEDGIHNDNSY